MKGYVYSLTNEQGAVYVGITSDLSKRMYAHRAKSRGLKCDVLEEFEDVTKQELMHSESLWMQEMSKRGHELVNGAHSSKVWTADCYICGKPISISSAWSFEGEQEKRRHRGCRVPQKKPTAIYVEEEMASFILSMSKSSGLSLNKTYIYIIEKGLESLKEEKSQVS